MPIYGVCTDVCTVLAGEIRQGKSPKTRCRYTISANANLKQNVDMIKGESA